MRLERSTPKDQEECIEWMALNRSESDAAIRSLKGCTFFKIAGILYLPVKVVLMLESIGPNPMVRGKRRGLALRRAILDLRKLHPHAEIIFLTKGIGALDDGAKSLGFEELPYKVYRLRTDAAPRAREKYRTQIPTEDPLQHDSGTRSGTSAAPARAVCGMRDTSRSSEERDYRPHPRLHQKSTGNPVRPLQPDDRARQGQPGDVAQGSGVPGDSWACVT